MRFQSFRHRADSEYCFSLDEHRVKVRLLIDKIEAIEFVLLLYEDTFRFGAHNKEVAMRKVGEDAYFNHYEAIMEGENPRFRYIFKVKEKNGESSYLHETGLTRGYIHDLGFLSTYQICGENPADFTLAKPSWAGRIFYNIFPERFASSNKVDKSHVNMAWDPTKPVRKGPNTYAGGDLYGIIEKLPYLKSLGVGAIYLNPIYVSGSNHKYDIIDHKKVDPSLGGDEAFKELIEKAHGLDIKICLDLVFNHTSNLHPFFEDCCHNGKKSKYWDFYSIHGDFPCKTPCNYKTFGFVSGMPKLNTNNPEVVSFLTDIGLHYVRLGVDGFRLDVSDGVSHSFWKRFKMALKKENPEVLLIGENWLNGASYLDPDELDGLMDYPFLGIMSAFALGQKDARETSFALNASLARYKDGNNAEMLRLLSSHDIQRYIRLCKGDKGAFMCSYAALYFFPGFPNLYYGDEVLLDGGGDPDCRRPMDWRSSSFETPEFKTFLALGKIRREEPLKRGDVSIYEKDGLLIIDRYLNDQGFRLAINLTGSSKPGPELPACFGYRLVEGQIARGGFGVYKFGH